MTYCYVLATGLAFYSPHLYWIAMLLGGAPTSRFWHPIVALVFLATLAWMLKAWIGDMRITAVDRRWGSAMDRYITNDDERPAACRPLQSWPEVFLLGHGVGRRWVFAFRARSCGFRKPFRGTCASCATRECWCTWPARSITIGAFIIHVYMGTAMVRGGFTSIIRGEVSPAWARLHHRLWYERVVGK